MKKLIAPMGVILAGLAGCAAGTSPPTPNNLTHVGIGEPRCAALAGIQLGAGTVEKTEYVAHGAQVMPFFKRVILKVLSLTVKMPTVPPLYAPRDFCRVSVELRPVPGSLIKAQIWLPDRWNDKMYAAGGGGFNGGLFGAPLAMYGPLGKGYATVVNDLGHDMSSSAKFALDRPRFIDFGYRADHVVTAFTKDLITGYYGKPPRYSYFRGGSDGGREALMEARRFPEDYDGIIVGEPATSASKLVTSFAWNWQALHRTPGAPALGSKLKLVYDTVLRECDAVDGVRDGLIENPLACKFDPAELQCKAGDAPGCLNVNEVTALRKIYDGPRLRDGQQVFPGMPVGGEGMPQNWDFWITSEHSAQAGFAEQAFRWMVHWDSKWELSDFDIDRDYPLALERMAPVTDSDDPDISAFVGRGGKLIIYHGWADAGISAISSINYYNAVVKKVGVAAERQVRLFLVPGMRHGPGGPAPTTFDMLDVIDHWVAGGPAPDRVVAAQYEPEQDWDLVDPEARLVRTRPLCPWPKQARYNGSGSIDDQANFTCR
jgi:feruloyl esterase